MFRRIITTENVGDNAKLGKTIGQISVDTLVSEHEAINFFIDKKELLDAAFDFNRAKHEKSDEDANDARASMIRAFNDLEAMSTAFCEVTVKDDKNNNLNYLSHLKNIKAQVASDSPNYEKLSSEYYLLKASICGMANFKKMQVMMTAINATNELKSEQIEERKCIMM